MAGIETIIAKAAKEIGADEILREAGEKGKGVEKMRIDESKWIPSKKLEDIVNLIPEQLVEKIKQDLSGRTGAETSEAAEDEKSEGLTPEEKAKIKEETGWSDEIIDAIGSFEEYEIYKNAGLVEAEIGGRKCLIRTDIDWEQKDSMGRTNRQRAEEGLCPISKDGQKIHLHHIGQKADGPLAELTYDEHRSGGNDGILHDKKKESEIDRSVFNGEKEAHWKARANEGGNEA